MSDHNCFLSTEELACILKIKSASIRVRLCNTGSYHGIKPQKLPNGRLLWPASALQAFIHGEVK
ncbi:hypothetical protein [Marinomonas primoryensis]|jgi:hypothetical protein|uniref:hypothetical protein n=1 Tax=Marinomonas primoryensis TaxID=178399 RepID=UPI00370406EB